MTVFDDAIARLLQDAFELELQLGTTPSEAAFHITAGFKPLWRHDYQDDGSWQVGSYREARKINYVSRDSELALYRSDEAPVWEGNLRELQVNESQYFHHLALL